VDKEELVGVSSSPVLLFALSSSTDAAGGALNALISLNMRDIRDMVKGPEAIRPIRAWRCQGGAFSLCLQSRDRLTGDTKGNKQ
jgi:hypothetical protein